MINKFLIECGLGKLIDTNIVDNIHFFMKKLVISLKILMEIMFAKKYLNLYNEYYYI